MPQDRRVRLGRLLAAVEDANPIDVVDALAAELARMADATEVSLLIANFSGSAVVRLSHVTAGGEMRNGKNERTESLPLDHSVYQRVLFTQQIEVIENGGPVLVLIPVTERGDAIGILELSLPRRPAAEALDDLAAAAHALSYVLVVSRRHTDLFEWAQRDTPFSLAAEIQRRLLPSAYTAECGSFTIAGWLEPAHDAGGDTFDYSIDREHLYISITDAVGHGTQAALLATIAVSSLRNTRRALAPPGELATAVNAALLANAGQDQYVTGHVLRIRLADGSVELVNAGHPLPFLLRGGRARAIEVTADLPFGVQDAPYRVQTLQLQPGDRLLLVTDGYLERNAGRVDVERVLATTVDRHPRQIVQELASEVLEATGGRLHDDATAVCLDWLGPEGRRDATSGSSRDRNTVPSPVGGAARDRGR
jgi:serine phosphatase RsbU (regulator of sigma subunit)